MNQQDILTQLIDSLPFPVIYLEVGVLRGECIVPIAKNSKNVKACIGVDPYQSYTDPLHGNYFVGDATAKLCLDKCQENILHNEVTEKVTLIIEDSHTAKNKIPDESLGVIFIDKNFTREVVMQDIFDWWPKLKKGGYLTGHEWDSPMVKKAVIDALLQLGLNEGFTGKHNVWMIKKP